jgi:uncharacterized protein (DUF2252 family)
VTNLKKTVTTVKKTATTGKKTLSPCESGEQMRKTLPRTNLAAFRAKDRQRTPRELLDESMHDRVPALAAVKHDRMACSAFAYFRGAVPVMAYDLSLQPHTGIVTQLCGDAHVQNLGAYAGLDGRLLFDINDFDETIRGPFEWDVKRMTTSILLAGSTAGMKQAAATEAAAAFLNSYCELMGQFSRMAILSVVRYQVHRLGSVTPVEKILRKAQRCTPMGALEHLTEKTAEGRVFKTNTPILRPLNESEYGSVLASLAEYTESLLPERRHFLSLFRPVAGGFKVVGTGSVGLRDYCILFEGNGPGDPLFLQIKQESKSAYEPYLPKAVGVAANDGQRTVEGQRAMQLQSDPMLGWTTIDGRSYLVRQLNDHKAGVNLTTLKAAGLAAYAAVCGELLARGHARSGDARVIHGYVGTGKRFKEAIHGYAASYAAQTVTDWKAFVEAKGSGGKRKQK